jgi:hypothetical protein
LQHAWFKNEYWQIGYAAIFSLMKWFMVLAANVALDPNNIDFFQCFISKVASIIAIIAET